jgi:DNA recombination protein RmuC
MQNFPVILAIIVSAAAIVGVLFWRIKPQAALNTDALDKRILEETKRAEALQAKLEAKEDALRTAEANSAAAKATMDAAKIEAIDAKLGLENAKSKSNALQVELNQAKPLVAKATAEKEASEAENIKLVKRHDDLVLEKNNLQNRLDEALQRAATAGNEADNTHIRNGEILAAYEIKVQELDQVNEKLNHALAKQKADEAASDQFKVIGQTALKEMLEEAKRGVGELAASFQKTSGVELEKHAGQVARTLEPLQVKLEAYDKSIKSMEDASHKTFGGLTSQIAELQKTEQSLHNQAKALTTALSSNPKMRGNYGELALKRLVEHVGMHERCHFETQVISDTEDGRKIPDMVISLPGEQKVIVDAKAVVNACVEAYQTEDEDQRKLLFKKHSENVKLRVSELSGKNYFANHVGAIESVVLFLPTDSLYFAALENDPDLTDFAASRKIIICSPGSLIMLLTVANHLWRQASIEKEAQDIKKCGEDIFNAACMFVEKYEGIGKRIQDLQKEYNGAVGTLEARLIPAGKRMEKFESVLRKREIIEIMPVIDQNITALKDATKQLAARTAKLPDLVIGDETAELEFSAGEK